MYLEYNWTACCFQPRFGRTFIDINGRRSYENIHVARDELELVGLTLGKKTDSRTWEIVAVQS